MKTDNTYISLGRFLDINEADKRLDRIVYGSLWPIHKIFNRIYDRVKKKGERKSEKRVKIQKSIERTVRYDEEQFEQ